MLKRTVVRLLLFGIPFGLSYWVTRPTAPAGGNQTLVICAYPGDRPGELRINVDPSGCSETEGSRITAAVPGSAYPAVNIPQTTERPSAAKPLNIPF
jgi:hypothetical protein